MQYNITVKSFDEDDDLRSWMIKFLFVLMFLFVLSVFQVQYHADFERQKGKKITIADDPEAQRVRQNMEVISNVSYHGEREKRTQQEMARPAEQVEGKHCSC